MKKKLEFKMKILLLIVLLIKNKYVQMIVNHYQQKQHVKQNQDVNGQQEYIQEKLLVLQKTASQSECTSISYKPKIACTYTSASTST